MITPETGVVITRVVDTEVLCPRCGHPMSTRQMRVRDLQHELGPWITARRFCPAGCILLGEDLGERRAQ